MMHHTHPSHHSHVHQVNVHPSQMHPQPPHVNMNVPPHQQHHIANLQPQVPPPSQQQQNPQHPMQRDQNRLNHHQTRMGPQIHQQPPPQPGIRPSPGHNSVLITGIQQHKPQQHMKQNHLQSNTNTSIIPPPLKQQQPPPQPHQQIQQKVKQQAPSHPISVLQPPPRIMQKQNDNSALVISNVVQQQPQVVSQQPPPPSLQQVADSTTNDVIINHNKEIILANDSLANIKEKTPMCLVNELARYNKIQHQYRLTGEQGPAHKKRFTVTLKLGDEEYTADGQSIKKAQHAAAGEAIKQTKYKHPPAKTGRSRSVTGKNGAGNITPTVELNALAMKRGEPATYSVDYPAAGNYGMVGNGQMMGGANLQNNQAIHQIGPNGQPQPNQYVPPQQQQQPAQYNQYGNFHRNNANNLYHPRFHGYERRGMGRGGKFDYQQRFMNYNNYGVNGNPEDPYRITLQVGQRKFLGVGNTLQAARHDAASRALEVLKPLTPESTASETPNSVEEANSELKSPISLVHEMALKRNLTVQFEVQSEKGPPHMKTFITLCRVGTVTTEGDGNGKKISKKRAAERMMDELKKVPPPSPTQRIMKNKRKQQVTVKKKSRNLIKEKSGLEPDFSEDQNPISRLIQIQQSRKEKEPVYTLVDERGAPRRREFLIEVAAAGQSAQGAGPNKKVAKRMAAENLLVQLGYERTPALASPPNKENNSKTANIPANVVIASNPATTEKSRKVTFQETKEIAPTPTPTQNTTSSQGGSAGRQLVPGLLLMQKQDNSKSFTTTNKLGISPQTTATIAKELLNDGISPTADAIAVKNNGGSSAQNSQQSPVKTAIITTSDSVGPKDQLMYLAQLLDFTVNYTDFPKGNHGEFLTLISISTDPPQLLHGSGTSTDASRDAAATEALKMLSKLGLDNVKPKKCNNDDKKSKSILTNGIKK